MRVSHKNIISRSETTSNNNKTNDEFKKWQKEILEIIFFDVDGFVYDNRTIMFPSECFRRSIVNAIVVLFANNSLSGIL